MALNSLVMVCRRDPTLVFSRNIQACCVSNKMQSIPSHLLFRAIIFHFAGQCCLMSVSDRLSAASETGLCLYISAINRSYSYFKTYLSYFPQKSMIFCIYSTPLRNRESCDLKRRKTGRIPNAFLTKHLAPWMDSCVF